MQVQSYEENFAECLINAKFEKANWKAEHTSEVDGRVNCEDRKQPKTHKFLERSSTLPHVEIFEKVVSSGSNRS